MTYKMTRRGTPVALALRLKPSAVADGGTMVEPHYNTLLPIYLDEAVERMRSMEQALETLRRTSADQVAWGAVKQSAHALAGNSAMMGFEGLAKTARVLERHAADVQNGGAGPAEVLFLDRGFQALRCLLECVGRNTERSASA
jgi:HPt (histidine-containing phosphotransfer) domain-containing protein